jgi:hypothetical protein
MPIISQDDIAHYPVSLQMAALALLATPLRRSPDLPASPRIARRPAAKEPS